MTHQILMPSAWITPALLQDGAQSGGGVIGAPSTGATLPAASGAPAGADGTAAQPGGSNIFFFFIIMTVGMLLIMSLSGRKEKKKRAQMLAALGKKDKVRTAGGIIGTVIEIKDDEVLLETDRASHTRLWLTRASISSIIKQSSAPSEDTNEPVTEKNA
jgi:preprotein translocase subunit YajC